MSIDAAAEGWTADYDPSADFESWFDDSTADAEPSPAPAQLQLVKSPIGWAEGGITETRRLLELLPPVPERQRSASKRKAAKKIESENAERVGDQLALAVPVSELLERLGWRLDRETSDGSHWIRPDHSEPYDGSHDATVYHRDDDGIERVTVFSEHQRATWGLTDEHSCSSFDLLGRVFCRGDFVLAANVARSALASPAPLDAIADLLDGGEPDDKTFSRLQTAAGATTGSGVGRKGRRVVTLVVDTVTSCVRKPDKVDKEGNSIPGEVVLSCAPRIVASTFVCQDLVADEYPTFVHDLAIRVDGVEHVVHNVDDADLADYRPWLTLLPDGGVGITASSMRTIGSDIEHAIRDRFKVDSPPIRKGIRRTGWADVDGQVGWVSCAGALTHLGLDNGLRTTQVTGAASVIALEQPDPARLPDDLRRVLTVPELLSPSAKRAWTALVSAMAWATCGVTPPGAALIVHGRRGSGKTTLVSAALSALTSTPDSFLMTTAATGGAIDQLGAGVHHAPAWLDDAHDQTEISRSAAESQAIAIDRLIRRSYGGASAGRQRLHKSGSGRYELERSDPCSPLAIITAEAPPRGASSGSTLERALTVEMVPEDPAFEQPLESLFSDGSWRRAWGGFVQWLASQISSCGPSPSEALAAWQRQLASEQEDMGVFRASGLSPRQAAVAASFAAGWRVWCRYLADVLGEMPRTGKASIETSGVCTISDLADLHAKVIMAPEEFGSASVIDRVRQALASGVAWIDGMSAPADARTCKLIGRACRADDQEAVALIPDAVGAVLGLKGSQVVDTLADILVKDPTGRLRRNVKFGNATSRCVVLLREPWFPSSDTEMFKSASTQRDAVDDEDF